VDAGLIAQLCAAIVLLAVGLMLVAVSSLLPGLVLISGGGLWLVRSIRRL
jgi:hypothetical protein